MSQADIEAGAQALENYVASVDWRGRLVPWNDYEQGAQLVLAVWDAAATPNDSTYLKCGNALYKSISAAGYGNQVNLAECTAGARAVLAAVRGK